MAAGSVVNIYDLGATAAVQGGGSVVQSSGKWDLKEANAIYATDGSSASSPNQFNTFLSALALPRDANQNLLAGTGLTAGINAVSLVSPAGNFSTSLDVGSINASTATSYPSAADARAAFNNAANWVRDGSADGSTPGPEARALSDGDSPLHNKFSLLLCFMPGTQIATRSGEVAVETLSIGDEVLTHDGKVMPVRWIGRQTVSTLFADPLRTLPIRIRAGALAEGVPSRDLLVSPDHALLIDGVLVQAGALVNDTSITREHEVPLTYTYYHVELEDHSLILAENTPAETFVDNVGRRGFDNWAEHEALYPDAGALPEMAYPRAKSARQVPSAVRTALALRAEAMVGPALEEAA